VRVQGGTFGIIAAIDAGKLDPFDAALPDDLPRALRNNADWRAVKRRDRRRLKKALKRERVANPSPF